MRENLSKKRERVLKIIGIFDEIYGGADCSLDFRTPLELLIATQLAAQCTDARVNIVTKDLFKKYTSVEDFANANLLELEQDIKSTGFYRNKAKNIIACCKRILSEYNGEIPNNLEDMLTLAGVGRKTANLVLGDIFGIPGIVVDTHATRISNLLGLTANKDPYKIELDLQKVVPKENWGKFCHQLVLFGREYCIARRPKCDICPIAIYCPSRQGL
ncbi:MAG: endonuclease III [Oscillospiraceae bacterium]|nr:endonuclease III [Oscillospiraceae bacterium]